MRTLPISLGRFSAHWEHEGQTEDGPQSTSVEDALSWGRSFASRVVVRVGEDELFYTAGEEPVSGSPPWPRNGIRVGRRLAPTSIMLGIGVHE
jgi:hypothetical protein